MRHLHLLVILIEVVLMLAAVFKFASLQLLFAILVSIGIVITLDNWKFHYEKIAETSQNKDKLRQHIVKMGMMRALLTFFGQAAYVLLLAGVLIWDEAPGYIDTRVHETYIDMTKENNLPFLVQLRNGRAIQIQAAPDAPTMIVTQISKQIRDANSVIKGIDLTTLLRKTIGDPGPNVSNFAWAILAVLLLFSYAFAFTDRVRKDDLSSA